MGAKTDAGAIVCTPAPGMLNVIVSAPGFALASRIACRSEPAPLSLVLVTVNVAAKRDCAWRSEAAVRHTVSEKRESRRVVVIRTSPLGLGGQDVSRERPSYDPRTSGV